MLETNDVDVDLFTPATGTSLATIFSNMHDQNEENTSLKYVPEAPIPPVQSKILETDNMAKTQCIFATSVSAYEWVDNKYNLRDNLGVALVKAVKDNIHQLIVYTSEKNTLSLATISPKFVVNVKKDISISYYDDKKKYWLICASVTKITNIMEHLKNLKVIIKYLTVDDIAAETEIDKTKDTSKQHLKEHLDSDTDSSINRRNKESILQRMATMGQSVLPPNKGTALSTDSSDTNEYDHLPSPRHKHTKSLTKRYTVEKNVSTGIYHESNKNLPNTIQVGKISSICTVEKQDVVPKNTIDNTSHLLNLDSNSYNITSFISEQRISSSELRININRLSDKVEQLFDKVSVKGLETYCSNQQNEIVNKLLKEYETKIMTYENFIKSKGFDCNIVVGNNINGSAGSSLLQIGDDFNKEMKQISGKQDDEVERLKKEIQELIDSQTANKNKYEDILLKEIHNLKQDLHIKNDLLSKVNENIQTLTDNTSKDDFLNKLKIIMNCTYQRISDNFNDEDTYPGIIVKNIVAKAIKKTTMESINDRV